jgi:hypothetical protein
LPRAKKTTEQMDITINAAWLILVAGLIVVAFIVGHFSGWYSAHQDFFNDNQNED